MQPPIRVEGRKPPIGGNGGREAPNVVKINKSLNTAKPLQKVSTNPGTRPEGREGIPKEEPCDDAAGRPCVG